MLKNTTINFNLGIDNFAVKSKPSGIGDVIKHEKWINNDIFEDISDLPLSRSRGGRCTGCFRSCSRGYFRSLFKKIDLLDNENLLLGTIPSLNNIVSDAPSTSSSSSVPANGRQKSRKRSPQSPPPSSSKKPQKE